MRLSQFWSLMDEEFGRAMSRSLAQDHVLTVWDRTPAQALAAGIPAREVWVAVCNDLDVPPERRLGRRKEQRR